MLFFIPVLQSPVTLQAFTPLARSLPPTPPSPPPPPPPPTPSQSMSSHIARIESAIRAHILDNEEDFLGSVGGVSELSRRTEEFRDGVRELRRSFARVRVVFIMITSLFPLVLLTHNARLYLCMESMPTAVVAVDAYSARCLQRPVPFSARYMSLFKPAGIPLPAGYSLLSLYRFHIDIHVAAFQHCTHRTMYPPTQHL